MAAQGCILLLLNVFKRTFYDHQIAFISILLLISRFWFLALFALASLLYKQNPKSAHKDLKASAY